MTDPAGLEAVLLANRAPIVRFLRARGAGGEGEDIFQDLWLKVAALSQTGPIGDPLAYLYRMANNLMHDRHRTAVRRRRREEGYGALMDQDAEIAFAAPDPERRLIAREALGRVAEALDAAGPRSRAIFQRFRLDGVSQKAIAIEEGLSLSAVEKHLQRAYRAVAAVLMESGADTPEQDRPVEERVDDAAD